MATHPDINPHAAQLDLRPVYTVRLVGHNFSGGFEKKSARQNKKSVAVQQTSYAGPIFFQATDKSRANKSHRVNRPLTSVIKRPLDKPYCLGEAF